MAVYGVTDSGFIPKRLEDILADQRAKADEIFKDLVAPEDIVDTSDSTLLGRLINLDSAGDAQLWEQGQAIYSAFDPNSSTGIALDNIVAYGNLARFKAYPSTALCMFYGDNGTVIPIDSYVSDQVTGNKFRLTANLALNLSKSSKIEIRVGTVSNSTAYTVSYANNGGSFSTITYTSDSGATEAEILAGLLAALSAHPTVAGIITGDRLLLSRTVELQITNWVVTDNIVVTKVGKIGQVICDVNGVVSQQTNTLTNIDTPVIGWETVTNISPAVEGRLTETDEELRLRFRNTKFTRSINILDSLYSELLEIAGVTNVAVYENDTDVYQALYDLPAHSFRPVVLGGSPTDIGDVIWKNKPTGIGSVGNQTVTIYDSQRFSHDMKYTIPDAIPIYVTMEIDVDAAVYPADGDDQIRNAIIAYATENFSTGDDVPASRLYTPINSIAGHVVNSLFIGIAPSPATAATVVINFDEIADFSSVNIIIDRA